jgi:UDP-glucose 4-epimerase
MKKKKYLISGCAGFIGSHLTKELYKKYDLILIDDLSSGKVLNLPKLLRKKIIKKKIENIKNFKANKLDGIFHLCAQASVPISIKDFYQSSKNNLNSSLKIFEISKKFNAPIVYASSSAVYGNLPLGDDTKNKVSISSPYAQDKLSIEHYAKVFFQLFKISSIGLRLFNVYGPGQSAKNVYASVIPIFIYNMFNKKKVTINGGYQTRDFVYIKDVVKIMIKSMGSIKTKKRCEVFNLGTGKSISINNLFQIIKKITNTNPKVIKKKLESFDPKKSSGKFSKISKFLRLKKYKYTKLEVGLKQTVEYFNLRN